MTNKNANNQTKQTYKNLDEFKEVGKEIGNTLKQFVIKSSMFLAIVFVIIFCIVYLFGVGGFVLYLSKLGGSNILPTNKDFFPYTNVNPVPPIIPTLENIFADSKIVFPYDVYNSSNFLLNGTRKYKDTLQSSFYIIYLFMNYFITIYESMVQFNYTAMNFVLYVMSKIPDDTLIILFGPTILAILTGIISIINPMYFIFTWFASLKTFFEFEKNAEQLERNADFKGIWKSLNMILNVGLVPISIIFALWMACLMFVMFFFSTWWSFLAVAIILWLVMISCMFYAATINGIHVNVITTILGLLKFYKFSLMTLISCIIALMSFFYFGISGGITCLVVLLLIFLGVFNNLGLDTFSSTGVK
jgi:hypothetical protein